jgi:uncharacterized membrane protein (UPF0127 family)
MTSRGRSFMLSLLLLLGCLRQAAAAPPPVSFDREEVTVVTGDRARRVKVELAITPEQRARGLMFRDSLAPDGGMLFLFDQERPVTMWMKDTRIPLDLLFLGPDGRILKIAEGARPFSLAYISCDLPALGVLEVPGGTARSLGWKAGDRVLHRAFGRAP